MPLHSSKARAFKLTTRDLTRSAHEENQTSPGRPSSKRTFPPVSNSSISSDTARLHARPTTSLKTPSCLDDIQGGRVVRWLR